MMIILSIISLIFSFLLQGLITNFISFNVNSLSIFSSVFVLVNLVVLQEYFESDKKFIILFLVFGLFMDIVYNSTVLISCFIFFAVFYINKGLNFFLPYNLLTVNLFSVVSMIVYHFITFLFLIIIRYDVFPFVYLFKIIGCNLLMTVIYTSIMYSLIKYIVKKFELRVVR